MIEEKDFKPIIKEIFRGLGFEAHELERRSNALTPDFEVIGKNSRYTVELKIKGDDLGEISDEAESLLSGQIVSKLIPIGPRNQLSRIIRDGVKQMLAHDPEGDSFRIIWLHSSGQDPDLHRERFLSTLYGIEKLFRPS